MALTQPFQVQARGLAGAEQAAQALRTAALSPEQAVWAFNFLYYPLRLMNPV
jgi:hypothetical protein